MAYQMMGKSLSEVASGGTIDELDNCAYELLAALFSLVERDLHGRLQATYARTFAKKAKSFPDLQAQAQKAEDGGVGKELSIVLTSFNKSPGKVDDFRKREKLSVLWRNALNPLQVLPDDFFASCCSLMAHLDMADMPGNQCIAVVRDSNRILYVTGNGLWGPGDQIQATRQAAPDFPSTVDEPWFSTGAALQAALDDVAGDIMAEYHLTRVLLINPVGGEVEGKFHAEMQLLEYMLDNGIYPERGYIGVSKPCCNYCRLALDPAGIKYWNGHTVRGEDPNKKVPVPYTSYKSADKLISFRANLQYVPFYGVTKNHRGAVP